VRGARTKVSADGVGGIGSPDANNNLAGGEVSAEFELYAVNSMDFFGSEGLSYPPASIGGGSAVIIDCVVLI
ncbi:unnamed protein product, partial [marine sediment metagenome]